MNEQIIRGNKIQENHLDYNGYMIMNYDLNKLSPPSFENQSSKTPKPEGIYDYIELEPPPKTPIIKRDNGKNGKTFNTKFTNSENNSLKIDKRLKDRNPQLSTFQAKSNRSGEMENSSEVAIVSEVNTKNRSINPETSSEMKKNSLNDYCTATGTRRTLMYDSLNASAKTDPAVLYELTRPFPSSGTTENPYP